VHYRMTAVYLIVGVTLTTAHPPRVSLVEFQGMQDSAPKLVLRHKPVFMRLRIDLGLPPILFVNIAYHTVAAWYSLLGVLWDVRRRMREWALIRLAGGHPCLIAGFQYFCISILGILMGGGLAILTRFRHPVNFGQMMAISAWGILFSLCVSVGPIAYTEFFDMVSVIRVEGEVR